MGLFKPNSRSGAAAEERLQHDQIAWLTTVTPEGMPQSSPVWFIWDGESFLVYSEPDKPKVRNIEGHAQVSLHLEGDRRGGDVVTMEGTARIDRGAPSAEAVPAYVEKYRDGFERLSMSAAKFAAAYSVPIRIRPSRPRAWLVSRPTEAGGGEER